MAEANRQIVLEQLPQGAKFGARTFPADRGRHPDGPGRARCCCGPATSRSTRPTAPGCRARPTARRSSAGTGDGGRRAGRGRRIATPDFAPGDLVFADTGWQDYAALPAKRLSKLPNIEPMTHLMSVYGIAGLTAYFGLLECGQPKAGETVVVSAAAGSVGSIVGQIAKIKGCRVIGIAGGAEKGALAGRGARLRRGASTTRPARCSRR